MTGIKLKSLRAAKTDHERFYLLPGQGGEGHRRKRRQNLRWAFLAGIVLAGLLSAVFYWLNRTRL